MYGFKGKKIWLFSVRTRVQALCTIESLVKVFGIASRHSAASISINALKLKLPPLPPVTFSLVPSTVSIKQQTTPLRHTDTVVFRPCARDITRNLGSCRKPRSWTSSSGRILLYTSTVCPRVSLGSLRVPFPCPRGNKGYSEIFIASLARGQKGFDTEVIQNGEEIQVQIKVHNLIEKIRFEDNAQNEND